MLCSHFGLCQTTLPRQSAKIRKNPIFSNERTLLTQSQSVFIGEWGKVAAGEEAVDVGLGVPVFVAVAGVAEKAVVAEAFQVAVFDAEEGH